MNQSVRMSVGFLLSGDKEDESQVESEMSLIDW